MNNKITHIPEKHSVQVSTFTINQGVNNAEYESNYESDDEFIQLRSIFNMVFIAFWL